MSLPAPACTALFARALGDAAFSTLPQRVQALHLASGTRAYAGEATVETARTWLGRLCAWATSLPSDAVNVAVRVEIASDEAGERWDRRFGRHRMPSSFRLRDGLLIERIGPATFAFALCARDDELIWSVRRVRALGVPLPARWFRGVRAREFQADGRYRFDVAASLPLAGLLVRYTGWLDVPVAS